MIFFGIRDFFLHPEMSPRCAHLLPSDGDSTDDYCWQHHDCECREDEPGTQRQLRHDRQITMCGRSVIIDSKVIAT